MAKGFQTFHCKKEEEQTFSFGLHFFFLPCSQLGHRQEMNTEYSRHPGSPQWLSSCTNTPPNGQSSLDCPKIHLLGFHAAERHSFKNSHTSFRPVFQDGHIQSARTATPPTSCHPASVVPDCHAAHQHLSSQTATLPTSMSS